MTQPVVSGVTPAAGAVTQLHFLLATCGNDNLVKLWDVLAYSGSASEYSLTHSITH